VASLEERLQRQEWNPAPGEALIGTITKISERESKAGKWYPVLVVQDADGAEHIVSCALMASDVIAARPVRGERVGIRFDGPQSKASGDGTYDRYVIEFEKDDEAEPDWDRMAASRSQPAVPGALVMPVHPVPSDEDPWTTEPAGGFTDENPFT
jgi:hypothetical protein